MTRVLVVEDEAIIAADLQLTLQRFGYAVPETVDTGEAAVERARILEPDLILMDIRLKGEMDGISAAERITRERDVPIIFLTAYTDEETLRRARLALPFAYVVKPFQEAQLRTAIGVALDKHAHDAARNRRADMLDAVLGTLQDAVLVVAGDGRIAYANAAAAALLGVREEALHMQPLGTAFPLRADRAPSFPDAVATAFAGGATEIPRAVIQVAGRDKPVACHVAPLPLQAGPGAVVLVSETRGVEPLAGEARRAHAALLARARDLV